MKYAAPSRNLQDQKKNVKFASKLQSKKCLPTDTDTRIKKILDIACETAKLARNYKYF